jgi:hypothetical protein
MSHRWIDGRRGTLCGRDMDSGRDRCLRVPMLLTFLTRWTSSRETHFVICRVTANTALRLAALTGMDAWFRMGLQLTTTAGARSAS